MKYLILILSISFLPLSNSAEASSKPRSKKSLCKASDAKFDSEGNIVSFYKPCGSQANRGANFKEDQAPKSDGRGYIPGAGHGTF